MVCCVNSVLCCVVWCGVVVSPRVMSAGCEVHVCWLLMRLHLLGSIAVAVCSVTALGDAGLNGPAAEARTELCVSSGAIHEAEQQQGLVRHLLQPASHVAVHLRSPGRTNRAQT